MEKVRFIWGAPHESPIDLWVQYQVGGETDLILILRERIEELLEKFAQEFDLLQVPERE